MLKQLLSAVARGADCADNVPVARGPYIARTNLVPFQGPPRPNGDVIPQVTPKFSTYELEYRSYRRQIDPPKRTHETHPYNQFGEFNRKARSYECEQEKQKKMLASIISQKPPLKKRKITWFSPEQRGITRNKFITFEAPPKPADKDNSADDSYGSSDSSDSEYTPEDEFWLELGISTWFSKIETQTTKQ